MSTDIFEGEHVSVTRYFAGRVHGAAYQVTSTYPLNQGTERYCQLTREGLRELLGALLALAPELFDVKLREEAPRG